MDAKEAYDSLVGIDSSNVDNHGISILYKGVSGSGKTHNALTWPEPIRGAYFDKNLMTLRVNAATKDIALKSLTSWHEYEDIFIPAVKNRLIDAKTIVIDTFDMMATNLLWPDIQGTKSKLSNVDFGTGLNRLVDTTSDLVDATRNLGDGSRYYNVVVTCHIKDITDDTGALIKIAPHVMGAFKDVMEDFFDYVLLCESSAVRTPVRKDGKMTTDLTTDFKCYTVPPSPLHTCKGGGLPPIVSGEYSALRAAFEETVKPKTVIDPGPDTIGALEDFHGAALAVDEIPPVSSEELRKFVRKTVAKPTTKTE